MTWLLITRYYLVVTRTFPKSTQKSHPSPSKLFCRAQQSHSRKHTNTGWNKPCSMAALEQLSLHLFTYLPSRCLFRHQLAGQKSRHQFIIKWLKLTGRSLPLRQILCWPLCRWRTCPWPAVLGVLDLFNVLALLHWEMLKICSAVYLAPNTVPWDRVICILTHLGTHFGVEPSVKVATTMHSSSLG